MPPSALSRKVTSAPRFSVPSGRMRVSGVAICLLQDPHRSGSRLMARSLAPTPGRAIPRRKEREVPLYGATKPEDSGRGKARSQTPHRFIHLRRRIEPLSP